MLTVGDTFLYSLCLVRVVTRGGGGVVVKELDKVGQPTKYTPTRVKMILDGIRGGLSHAAAAKRAGVHYLTVRRWKDIQPGFRAMFEQAEVEREESLVAIVEEGSKRDWRAAKFLLECRHHGWSRDSKTSQENRDLMDRLKIMEQALTVKLGAIKVQKMALAGEDYNIVDILNEVHGIEEKFDDEIFEFGPPGEPKAEGGQGAEGAHDEEKGSVSEGEQEEPGLDPQDQAGQSLH